MSLNKFLLISILGGFLGMNLSLVLSPFDKKVKNSQNFIGHSERSPSSLGKPMANAFKPYPIKTFGDSPFKKMNQSIAIDIFPNTSSIESNSEFTKLIAEVTLNQELQGPFTFTWKIPPGVTVINGELEGSITDLRPGVSRNLEITISQFYQQTEIKTLHLFVTADNQNAKISSVGSFANRTLRGNDIQTGFLKSESEHLQKKSEAGKLKRLQQ